MDEIYVADLSDKWKPTIPYGIWSMDERIVDFKMQ